MSYEVIGSLSLSDKNVFRLFGKNYFFFLVNLLTGILSKAHKLGKEWADVIDTDAARALASHIILVLKKKIIDRKLVTLSASSEQAAKVFDASCSLLLHQAAPEFFLQVARVAGVSSVSNTTLDAVTAITPQAQDHDDTELGSGDSDVDSAAGLLARAAEQSKDRLPRKTESEILQLSAKELTKYKKDLAANNIYLPLPSPDANPKATTATTATPRSSAEKDTLLAKQLAPTIINLVTKVTLGQFGVAATIEEAARLSADNVRRALAAPIDDKAIENNAHFAFLSRQADFMLVPHNQVAAFGGYLVDALSPKLRDCIRLHDDTAALSGGSRFSTLLSTPATVDAAIAQLQTWAGKLRRDKQELAAAVAAITPPAFVAALPSSSGPAAAPAARRWGCHHCVKRGLPGAADHSREDCVAGYRCGGCGKVGKPNAPVGHTWRGCPNPTVGGVCPAHGRP